jgi:hypothetical protein
MPNANVIQIIIGKNLESEIEIKCPEKNSAKCIHNITG